MMTTHQVLKLGDQKTLSAPDESTFAKLTVLVTDGHLAYPYGREVTGYEVANLADTLTKAKGAGVTVLVAPYQAGQREAAIVQFPGGYIAEIHSQVKK
jgi:hypothetical protein